jgi:hypothetical protein
VEAPQAVEKMAIIFPKVPQYVKGPVAPLFQEWAGIAEAYERAPASLHEAWLYLGHHPAFWEISEGTGGFYVATGGGWYHHRIELGVNDDNSVWLEIQPTLWPDDPETKEGEHQMGVDAPTYELAVLSAAALVHTTYRNDRQFLTRHLTDKWY